MYLAQILRKHSLLNWFFCLVLLTEGVILLGMKDDECGGEAPWTRLIRHTYDTDDNVGAKAVLDIDVPRTAEC